MVHSLKLRIEGFALDRLITECMVRGISMRGLQMKSEIEMILSVTAEDYRKILKLVKSRYRITVLAEQGVAPRAKGLWTRKITLIGVALFAFLLYYQSLFVTEIRVFGYESIPESGIRKTLREAGLYEGCRKNVDVGAVKQALYDQWDNIVWVSVSARGNLAEVQVVEGRIPPPVVGEETPCHIVAEKAGYIAEIVPKEGLRTVEDGTYVNQGDILITGIVPLASTAYGTSAAAITERYVHAKGEVKAKTPYQVIFYQERFERSKEATGRAFYGFSLSVGEKKIDSLNAVRPFEVSRRTDRILMNLHRPFLFQFAFSKSEEVTLSERERTDEEIMKQAEAQLRRYMKENLPESAQILNKSLYFSRGQNIIEVHALFEALQEIGREQEITFGNKQKW